MAFSNQHYIELYINKQLVELESQESLNLRINNILFNPTKSTTTQSEYSYSFSIPSTPKNDKILDYANNLSKLNKFHARYEAQVYSDGMLIFNGSLTIQKYSAKDKKYTCNLVNIKVNTLEEIFGDMVMTSLKWEVDFDGAPTINAVNADTSTKYYFPLVAYSVFQKEPKYKDSVGSQYTPKKQIDNYNKWWIENFYPSLNVVETIRKAFENKGYTVLGSVFSDSNFEQLYASCNLAEEQVPEYNLGNKKFGAVKLTAEWSNYNASIDIVQELKFPYEPVRPAINASNRDAETEYNFDTIDVWNIMGGSGNKRVDIYQDTYMYDPDERVIVIPESGWYKIDMLVYGYLLDEEDSTFQSPIWYTSYYDGDTFERQNRTFRKGFSKWKGGYFTPLEIQLVRNYNLESNSIELIKGKYNAKWYTGDPNQSEYRYQGGSYTSSTYSNIVTGYTEFPHEDIYGAEYFTKAGELVSSTSQTTRNNLLKEFGGNLSYGGGGRRAPSGSFGGTTRGTTSGGRSSGGGFGRVGNSTTKYNTLGFMTKNGKVMPYDPAVSPIFICGFSTMSDGVVSVMKNGYSWSSLSTTKNSVMANVAGLDLYNISGTSIDIKDTTYCQNNYKNCPDINNSVSVNDYALEGSVTCMVYLEKNDILEMVAVQRSWDRGSRGHTTTQYTTQIMANLSIEAMSQRDEATLRSDESWNGYYSGTEFPTKLNLFNFTNKETKVREWLENVQKAFNLEYNINGNLVEVNTNRGIKKTIDYAVNVDDRVSSDDVDSEFISYPKEMAVKYKIDKEEYGFELTVPDTHINDEDWYNWGDSGYTIIRLNDDSYETSTSNVQTNFSYTYYMDFDYYQIYTDGTSAQTPTTIRIPVIEKSAYMAEGYDYEESAKHDGYSMTQRFWYRDQVSQKYVWLSSVLSDGSHETVDLAFSTNSMNNFNLSYKDTEKSIATEYFNIHPMLSSNYVKFGTYLSPAEYLDLKNGAMVNFDSDLYYVSEINGYDPSGNNKATLKLIKKT